MGLGMRMGLGMGNGNRNVPPVPGDDSTILGANIHHLPLPTTFNHEGVLWDQWDKSATSKNVLEFLRIDQVDSENNSLG